MRQQGAAFMRDLHYSKTEYDDKDGRLLDAESRLSTNTRYFAVSSLGQHTRGERIHDRGISPFRCLEPLKWLLARRGVISA